MRVGKGRWTERACRAQEVTVAVGNHAKRLEVEVEVEAEVRQSRLLLQVATPLVAENR